MKFVLSKDNSLFMWMSWVPYRYSPKSDLEQIKFKNLTKIIEREKITFKSPNRFFDAVYQSNMPKEIICGIEKKIKREKIMGFVHLAAAVGIVYVMRDMEFFETRPILTYAIPLVSAVTGVIRFIGAQLAEKQLNKYTKNRPSYI